MSNEWVKHYDELKEFISGHPEIQLDKNIVSIPAEVRPEFYRLFDAVRTAYINENFADALVEASLLGAKFAEVQDETIGRLNLKKIELEPQLGTFLKDPHDELMFGLFNIGFELLASKTDLASFESTAARVTDSFLKRVFHYGYEYWAMLNLICLTEPERAYAVPVRDQTVEIELTAVEAKPGMVTTDDFPAAVTSEVIHLNTNRITACLVPNVILRSKQFEGYMAIAIDLHDVFCKAETKSKNMEWLKIEDLRERFGRPSFWPDNAIYFHDKTIDIRMAADYINVARPDIIIDNFGNPRLV